MEPLRNHLEGYASFVAISLEDLMWHARAKVPSEPGWYFIRTTAPVEILKQQQLWARTYKTKRTGAVAKVCNYDLAARARRYNEDLAAYWNISEVYSGMASNLQARAREHTFADPGTGGLALSKYPTLRDYEWLFGYVTLRRLTPVVSCQDMMLRLGEQVWRSRNGWPLLCAE